jgi:non-heme chloroperoxidase
MRGFFHTMLAAGLVLATLGGACARAGQITDGFVVTSDGVRLHILQAAPESGPDQPVLVFVPGWTMPGWIWGPQLSYFSARFPVVAMDPRGQGDSDIPPRGYEPGRRGRDIADLLARIAPRKVVLIGWSLGVLDSLAYVHEYGDAQLAGLVLVDNSVGEEPAPLPARRAPHPRAPRPVDREEWMRGFVRSMFRRPQEDAYLDRLTEYALRTPARDAAELLAYPVPRTYWRDALYSVHKPILYVVRPQWAAQAANVAAHDPQAQTAVFEGVGHALFVDDASRFNTLLEDFISRRIAP